MTAIVTQRFHRLADTLADLKVKVRAALATELATAVGTAVRDVLAYSLIDHIETPPQYSGRWGDGYDDRNRWGDHDDYYEGEARPAVPMAAAVAVGINVGRWWLARQGRVATAVGVGVLTTALGLAGGPVARAALAVLAAATDVLNAESALARLEPF